MESHRKKLVNQTEKQFLRDAIDDAASIARSPEEFSKILDEKYHIILKNQSKPVQLSSPWQKKIYHWKNSWDQIHRRFSLESI